MRLRMLWDGDDSVVLRKVWRKVLEAGERNLYIRVGIVRGLVTMIRARAWLIVYV